MLGDGVNVINTVSVFLILTSRWCLRTILSSASSGSPLTATYEWSLNSDSMIRLLTWSGNIWISIAAGFFVIASLILFYKQVRKPLM